MKNKEKLASTLETQPKIDAFSFDAIAQNHLPEILGLLLVALGVYLAFSKGMERGKRKAAKIFDSQINQFKSDLLASIEAFKKTNRELKDQLKEAQLIPNGHAMINYTEQGVSVYHLNSGYVMRVERRFEHDAVAEFILGRKLALNEVVHHIFGPARNNNSPSNLCVLDRDQHDLIHTYLEREKNLKGRYPKVIDQKVLLKRHYHAILLEEALENKKNQLPAHSRRNQFNVLLMNTT